MNINFSISVENDNYVVRSGDRIVGICSRNDDPCNPVFWNDENGEPFYYQSIASGSSYCLAQKLADAFMFASRIGSFYS